MTEHLVYVFISTDRFQTAENLHSFLDPTYTDDADMLPSTFMREVEQSEYEPMCIEHFLTDSPVAVDLLLADASYASHWLPHINSSVQGNMALCVFSPNHLEHPERSSLTYLGSVAFSITTKS